jgi:DEAD/DEAH box helicase domain-containing protein
VKLAANDHLPNQPDKNSMPRDIPDTSERPLMPEIIEELKQEDWYKDQVVDHRSFERKEIKLGEIDHNILE